MPSDLIIQETFADLAKRAVGGEVTLTLTNIAPGAYSTVVTADGIGIEMSPALSASEGDTASLLIKLPLHRPMLTPYEVQQGWQPMDTVPRDGTRVELLLCGLASPTRVQQGGFYYGEPLMGSRDVRVLRGDQNVLSPSLQPVGWRIEEKKNV